MDGNSLEFVVSELNALPRSEWRVIAVECDVPRSTVEKIAYGVTKDPRSSSLRKLLAGLQRRKETA